MQKGYLSYISAITTVILVAMLSYSCEKYANVEKYQRPEWLVGKIYTQLSSVDQLSMFAQCIEDVGYDKILDQSGTYAVFAPSDSAFGVYLASKSYHSIDDISMEEKLRLVKSHILQMPWAKVQLQSLSARGWINLNDESNNKPLAFKRQTLLKNANKTYPVKVESIAGNEKAIIVEAAEATSQRTVYTKSRKYAPLFFDQFMAAAELSPEDYSFYFDRPYETGELYYINGKVDQEERFADNGFIYIIDKVTSPLYNAEELMEQQGHTEFLKLIHLNSDFSYNEEQTLQQEGADEGQIVEELFDLNYPTLSFNIHEELIYTSRNTLEYHNGIIVPSNQALNSFINSELIGNGKWADYNDIPIAIKQLLLNSHMAEQAIYKTNIDSGFYNALGDKITLDDAAIIEKAFGSNASYIATNRVIRPQALSSVCAPLYSQPRFQAFLCLYDKVKLLSLLKDKALNYSFFIIDDATIGEAGDQSLMQEWITAYKYNYTLNTINQEDMLPVKLENEDYKEMALGQIGIQARIGEASKEFIETLDGRHIIIDKTKATLTGGKPSKYGYNSNTIVDNHYQLIENYDNGSTYLTNAWLKFSSILTFTEVAKRPLYLSLLKKAGLADEYSLKFITGNNRYTLFIPSDSVINAHHLSDLPVDSLRNVLSHHILNNQLLFTDGRPSRGDFETLNPKHPLTIDPQPDVLKISQTNGSHYELKLKAESTNIICTKIGPDNYPITEAVIHEIHTLFE